MTITKSHRLKDTKRFHSRKQSRIRRPVHLESLCAHLPEDLVSICCNLSFFFFLEERGEGVRTGNLTLVPSARVNIAGSMYLLYILVSFFFFLFFSFFLSCFSFVARKK